MKRKDLVTGMRVTLRNHTACTVVKGAIGGDILYDPINGDCIPLVRYTEDLIHYDVYNTDVSELDIMRVSTLYEPSDIFNLNTQLCVLWERADRKKMTLYEIEELLGFRVELVNEEEEGL